MLREPEDMNDRDIEFEVLKLHDQLNLSTNVRKARRVGHLLLEQKRRLGHGHFLPWLKRVGLKVRTAQTYMQVAKAPKAPEIGACHDRTRPRRGPGGQAGDQKGTGRGDAAACTDPGLVPDIVHADSISYMRGLAGNSVPFIISDPPYGLGVTFGDWTDPDNAEDFWHWFEPYWDEMVRVVQPGGAVVFWQPYRNLPHLLSWFPGCQIIANCFTVRGIRQWEPVVRWTKPGAAPFVRFEGWSDWIDASAWYRGETGSFKVVHPCPKPLNDCREVVRRYTLPGTVVLDPFCGTGTIPLACQMEGRRYVGVDRYEALRRRGARATGGGRLTDTQWAGARRPRLMHRSCRCSSVAPVAFRPAEVR